jgi:hypothetical protein
MTALHSFFCPCDSHSKQYQKKPLRLETQSGLAENVRKILAIDDPLNDEFSSAASGQSGLMK